MKWPLVLLLIFANAETSVTDYARLTDAQRAGLKGNVHTEEVTEQNKATYTNGAWTITTPGTFSKITGYDRKGNLQFTEERRDGAATATAHFWKDEDDYVNAMITDKENDNATELAMYEFADDSTLLIKTFTTDEDSIAYDQLEEERRTYTAFGYRREHFAVKNNNKRRYLYYEMRTLSADTFSLNYYGDNATRYTNAILERDAKGNPTKILVYSEEDTSITVKKYTYH